MSLAGQRKDEKGSKVFAPCVVGETDYWITKRNRGGGSISYRMKGGGGDVGTARQ